MLAKPDPLRQKSLYRSGHWRAETIYDLAAGWAASAPESWAVRDRLRRLSYRAFVEAADRLADDLARHGLEAGDRVAIWLPSRVETAVAILACARNGYVCAPGLQRDHTVEQVLDLLGRMAASALILQPGYGADAERRDIGPGLATLESLRHVYRVPPLETLADGNSLFDLDPARAVCDPPPGDPDSVVYLPFTSGTTGEPKGVLHTDNTLLANARTIARDWHFSPDSCIYTMSPLSHNLGFGALISAIAVGAELVVHDLPRGASLLARLREVGASFLFGVPTHAIDLLAELRAGDGAGLPKLKGFRISGAAVPDAVCAELLDHGITPQSGYGMTEACSHHYTLPDDPPERITGTSGTACDGYEIRIWSQENPDQEAPVGEIGQIGGRGASLMLGYYEDPESTAASFNAHGFFMTGDLGALDADGYLKITGRKKDVIIRGGHNIYPARIESLTMRHGAVERAAAVPVPDDRLGERVCIAVTLRPDKTLTAEELLAHLDEAGLSKYDMPEFYLQIDRMPLTSNGKILKRELNAQIERGEVAPRAVRWTASD
jgi:acyl-CoA synthetase (AMP-forming)/AMP-acid ligase II